MIVNNFEQKSMLIKIPKRDIIRQRCDGNYFKVINLNQIGDSVLKNCIFNCFSSQLSFKIPKIDSIN